MEWPLNSDTASKSSDSQKVLVGHEVLDAYKSRDTVRREGATLLQIIGVGGAFMGGLAESTPSSVTGFCLAAIGTGWKYFDATRAYYAARLDYMQNGRFTALDKKE